MMAGKELVKPAKVAPIPSDTKRAGSAQQMSVPVDVNKLKPDGNNCLKEKLSDMFIQKQSKFQQLL